MVGSIGGFDAASFAATSALSRNKPSDQNFELGKSASAPSAKDSFRAYMKMTPAERMIDAWLKAHGLTKEKLAAMSPEDRDAIMKQMKDEVEQSLKAKGEKGSVVDIET